MISDKILDTWSPIYNCLNMLFPGLDDEVFKDIIQDSMIEFILNPEKEANIKNPFSYILKIAIRKTWKFIEEQKKITNSQSNLAIQYRDIKEINDNRLAMQTAIQSILDALSDLNDKEIKLLTMHFFNKDDFQTIAKTIGYSSADVARNAMSRSLKHLRKIIYQRNKNLDWWAENPYLSNFFHTKETI